MTASIDGAEWITVIGLVPIFLVLGRLVWRNPPSSEPSVLVTTHRMVMRLSIEAQLLALGVPPERSVEEARLILDRHLKTPITEDGIAEVHDDIVRTAGAWA